MKNKTLLHTNVLLCVIITIGFILTSIVSYQSNFGFYEDDIENVSTLALDGLYNQINYIFSQPVSVSLTMANDSLLKGFLSREEQNLDNEGYTEELRDYLNAYRAKYGYDSVFLVSSATRRYYHFNGLDRVLAQGDPENVWYYEFIGNDDEYSLNVDNDEASRDVITVFVNCKIKDADGAVMGVVGVGMKIGSLQELLRQYDTKFGVEAYLVDADGVVEISSLQSGYQPQNLFESAAFANSRDRILNNAEGKDTFWYSGTMGKGHVATQYVPSLKWHLIVEKNTSVLSRQFLFQFLGSVLIIMLILVLVLVIITRVIRRYNSQIAVFTQAPELEYQKLLHETTQGLYESIFEIDLTHLCAGSQATRDYFESLGMSGDTPYDEALQNIAHKQIKEEYKEGYLGSFNSRHLLELYEAGVNSVSYDFLIRKDNEDYHWMRITARLFSWASDASIRMIAYRENIHEEKTRELALYEKSRRDSLTGILNKGAAEELIEKTLREDAGTGRQHVLMILDIDNFKSVNDDMGHVFGDTVITEFAMELRGQFRDSDIVGRIGGDEFAVLMKDCGGEERVREKADRLFARLGKKFENSGCTVSFSLGAALFEEHGATYGELYEKADQALYYSKGHGKGSFCLYSNFLTQRSAFQASPKDMEALLYHATDGITKVACVDGRFKTLYFNQRWAQCIGRNVEKLSAPDFDVLALFHPDDVRRTVAELEKAIPERRSFTVSVRVRHGGGQYLPMHIKGFFVKELYQGRYPIFYAIYIHTGGKESKI